MSTSYYVYFGPYLKVKPITKTINSSVSTCSNEKCNNYIKTKRLNGEFCSACGSKIMPKPITKLETVNIYEHDSPETGKFTKEFSSVHAGGVDFNLEFDFFCNEEYNLLEADVEDCDIYPFDFSINLNDYFNEFKEKYKENVDALISLGFEIIFEFGQINHAS